MGPSERNEFRKPETPYLIGGEEAGIENSELRIENDEERTMSGYHVYVLHGSIVSRERAGDDWDEAEIPGTPYLIGGEERGKQS